MDKSLKEKALNSLAIDMLVNPYKYILHDDDMPEFCKKAEYELEKRGDWWLRQNKYRFIRRIATMCFKHWKGLNSDFLLMIEQVPGQKDIVINKLLEAIKTIIIYDNESGMWWMGTQEALVKLFKGTEYIDGETGANMEKIKDAELLWESIGVWNRQKPNVLRRQKQEGKGVINWDRVIEHWRITVPYIIQHLRYIQYKNNSGQIVNVPQNEKNRQDYKYPDDNYHLDTIEGVKFPKQKNLRLSIDVALESDDEEEERQRRIVNGEEEEESIYLMSTLIENYKEEDRKKTTGGRRRTRGKLRAKSRAKSRKKRRKSRRRKRRKSRRKKRTRKRRKSRRRKRR